MMNLRDRRIPIAIGTLILVTGLIVAAWRLSRDEQLPTYEGITLTALQANVTRALSSPGEVVHITRTDVQEPLHPAITHYWIDGDSGSIRARHVFDSVEPGSNDTITAGGKRYAVNAGVSYEFPVSGCDAAPNQVMDIFFGCHEMLRDAELRVVEDAIDGRPLIAILAAGKYSGDDSTVTFRSLLYIDPQTFLPVTLRRRISDDYARGPVVKHAISSALEYEFLARSSLPGDYFDPASIGFRPDAVVSSPTPDPAFPADVNVYWLGTAFRPPGRRDLDLDLTETRTLDSDDDGNHTYAVVEYGRDAEQEPSVIVQQYTRERWQSLVDTGGGPSWHRQDCVERTPLTGLGESATLIAAHADEQKPCSGPHDLFVVHIEYPDTIVEIHSHVYWPLNGVSHIYASPENIELAARSLVPR
jgi:hypothetical protein